MPFNALHHSMTRLRDFGANWKLNCGGAMLFDLLPNIAYGTGGSSVHTLLAPTTIGLQGISVLTFMGGPPIFNE